jgi:predicted metal-dependent enzyme (double-stranded beta helix superfamily)
MDRVSPFTPRPRRKRPLAGGHPARVGACRRYAEELLARPDEWLPHVRFDAGRRWYERVVHLEDHEVWLLSWLPGENTGVHDHAHSAGAFAVALGSLEEVVLVEGRKIVRPAGSGTVRAFGPEHIHQVRNTSGAPAVSIHAYSPPLEAMNHYEIIDSSPSLVTAVRAADWVS